MSSNNSENRIDPVDVQVGGDADPGGIAQTITSEDVQALLMSPDPVDARLRALARMRGDLETRAAADRGDEFGSLVAEIDDAIAQLSGEDFRKPV